jgi:hypothetical protein
MDDNRELETHLTTEQLLDYVERRLSPDEIGQAETHLAGDCSSCQEELTWLTATLNQMVSDVWVDAPVRLQASARQLYREQYSPKPERVSIGQWLQSLFTPRQPLVYAAIGILLVVVVTGLLLRPWSNPQENASVEIAAYQGTVEVQSPGSDTWESAESAGEINSGDDVRTGDESSVVLSFPDDSKTLMTPHTELRIVRMSHDEESGDQIIILQQQSGRTQNYVQPLPSTGSRFEIRTPAATVTVRGTSFSVEVEDDGTTRVAVSEGRVQVAAQGMTILLDAGQATEVISGSTPSVVVPAPTVPIPTEYATLVFTPAPATTEEPAEEVEATATRQPSATATSSLTPSPSPSAPPSVLPSPSPSAVHVTQTPTPELTAGPGPAPTEQPPQTKPTNTPEGPAPTSTPVPPATATTEPPPPSPTEDPWVPPGQTKTPQPPGQTRTPESSDKKTK